MTNEIAKRRVSNDTDLPAKKRNNRALRSTNASIEFNSLSSTPVDLSTIHDQLREIRSQYDHAQKIISGLKEHIVLMLSDLEELPELRSNFNSLTQRYQEAKKAIEALDAKKLQAEMKYKESAAEVILLTKFLSEAEQRAPRELQIGTVVGRVILTLLSAIPKRPFHSPSIMLRRKMKLVKRSGIFDASWYLSRYQDVAKAGADPLRHYVEYGANEGRLPSAVFATQDDPR